MAASDAVSYRKAKSSWWLPSTQWFKAYEIFLHPPNATMCQYP